MSFICIGNENIGKRACTYMISIYWVYVYIIVTVISGALYMTNYKSSQYKDIGIKKFNYILKLFGFIIVLLTISILLICIRIYREVISQN